MNPRESDPTSLEELLDRLKEADGEKGRVTLGRIFDHIGRRSFGPILLLAGVVTLTPIIGDIPGVPTLMAVFILLTAVQLLLGRERVWLPSWLIERTVAKEKLDKGVKAMRKPARFLDGMIRPRLESLVRGPGAYVIAVASIGIALAMPPMELIPFSANLAGAALTGFGLALTGRDGVLALGAYAFTGAMVWLVVSSL